MIFFLLSGLFVVIIGLFMLFAPEKLSKLNEILNKPIFNDQDILKNKNLFSTVVLAVGVLLIFTYIQHVFS